MRRYHFLGYRQMPGAQLKYLIHGARGLVAAIGFGSAAWKVRARDEWIGWTHEQRQRH